MAKYYIQRYRIIGTETIIYEAWEIDTPSVYHAFGNHGTITHLDNGTRVGRVTSRELPPKINAIPVGPARWERTAEWRGWCNIEADHAILKAFPHIAGLPQWGIKRTDGTIETVGEVSISDKWQAAEWREVEA